MPITIYSHLFTKNSNKQPQSSIKQTNCNYFISSLLCCAISASTTKTIHPSIYVFHKVIHPSAPLLFHSNIVSHFFSKASFSFFIFLYSLSHTNIVYLPKQQTAHFIPSQNCKFFFLFTSATPSRLILSIMNNPETSSLPKATKSEEKPVVIQKQVNNLFSLLKSSNLSNTYIERNRESLEKMSMYKKTVHKKVPPPPIKSDSSKPESAPPEKKPAPAKSQIKQQFTVHCETSNQIHIEPNELYILYSDGGSRGNPGSSSLFSIPFSRHCWCRSRHFRSSEQRSTFSFPLFFSL